jgi:hypothetical protein
MTWPVIIKRGADLNLTLATVQFGKFGEITNQEIFVCDEWIQGFAWAKQHQHSLALFVASGTVFKDWSQWQQLIDQYPHRGLVAHLIWHPGKELYINDQCWLMNIDYFEQNDFEQNDFEYSCPIRSDQNLHDDYTPLWIRPGSNKTHTTTTKFGQGIIARQMNRGQPAMNWNNAARDLKFFGNLPNDLFEQYNNIAENQLWVFNNEPVTVVGLPSLVTPGSGLSWMLNIINSATKQIQIVDISHVQIKFCQTLWSQWDGKNYGEFVWDFIAQHKLTHFEIDQAKLSALDRLKLKNRRRFVDYVNQTFESAVDSNFASQWQHAQQNKQVDFCNNNLITWVLNNDTDKYDHIWCSNILNYKWTLLHTTVGEYLRFQKKLNARQNQSVDV